MKITDMTDTLFGKEMLRIVGDATFWCIRLSQIGDYKLEPTPVSYMDGTDKQPFPLALEIKRVWDYAKGDKQRPEEIEEIIQDLCELLWSHIGGSSYDIPAEFWDAPLGFMCQLAWARQALDFGADLNAERLAMLAGITPQRVKQLCQSGVIKAGKTEQSRSSQQEWAIPAETARAWLEARGK